MQFVLNIFDTSHPIIAISARCLNYACTMQLFKCLYICLKKKKKAPTLSIKCQKAFSLTMEGLDRTQEILQLEKKC